MTLNNKKELFVYNKYIKSYVQDDDGRLLMNADVFVKTYTSMTNEKLKSIFVNCLNKLNVKIINNGNISQIFNRVEEIDDDNLFDDFSLMDEYIEAEILSQCRQKRITDDSEPDNSMYVDKHYIDDMMCGEYAKQYIQGYIDGRNFDLSDENTTKSTDQIIYTESINDKKRKQELRNRLFEILEVLNSVEREVIKLYFSDKLSIRQISTLLNLTDKAVDVIYNKALIKIKNNQKIDELKKLMK